MSLNLQSPEPPLPLETKVCAQCKEALLIVEFGVSSSRRDGLNPYCKSCNRDRTNVKRASVKDMDPAQQAAYLAQMEERRQLRETRKARLTVHVTEVLPETKLCPGCDAELPLDAFGLNCRRPCGRSIYCKSCNSQKSAAVRERKRSWYRARMAVEEADVPRTAFERVRTGLTGGAVTLAALAKRTGIKREALGVLLTQMSLDRGEVAVGTVGDDWNGERVYSLRK